MRYRFMRFPNGKQKAVTLSYDDGTLFDRRMVEILNRFGIKCTFNLSGWHIEKKISDRIGVDELYSLYYDGGHEVAGHTQSHAAPGNLAAIDGIKEVLTCRTVLERATGKIIRGMAYPDCGITKFTGGSNYDEVRTYLRSLGIAYSRTLGGDNDSFLMPTDWYAWMPTCHHTNPKLMEFVDKFLQIEPNKVYAAERSPRLFYLWGHSFEFENNNNWELLEQFCEKISGKDDIWYATNIEIYDYTCAYRSLIFNTDNTLVYNPSLIDVWFLVDDTEYCVKSGETLKLQ